MSSRGEALIKQLSRPVLLRHIHSCFVLGRQLQRLSILMGLHPAQTACCRTDNSSGCAEYGADRRPSSPFLLNTS